MAFGFGAKKKKGGKKKAGGKKKTPAQLEEENTLMSMRVETLERFLVLRTEQSQRSRQVQEEMHERMIQLDRDFNKEKAERFFIASDMIRQYKSTQQDLIDKINKAERRVQELEDKLAISNIALEQTREKKDAIIAQKNKEIEEQKQKMEDMVQEFGEMLKDTLTKMGRTIVDSSQADDSISEEILNNERLKEIIGSDALEHKLRSIRLGQDDEDNTATSKIEDILRNSTAPASDDFGHEEEDEYDYE
mmetsp:Transcript_4231/g.15976  ORF Transcript_4231/g.15976 Transcript_4231/m.15976 type:complete len:248 (-) Transcript_4231:101-844(-)